MKPSGLLTNLIVPVKGEPSINLIPSFNWIAPSTGDDSSTVSHQIELYSCDSDEIIWDSQRQITPSASPVVYAGSKLAFACSYKWRVRTFNDNQSSEWSEFQEFTTVADDSANDLYTSPVSKLVETIEEPVKKVESDNALFMDFEKAAFGTIIFDALSNGDDSVVEIYLGEKVSAPDQIDSNPEGCIRFAKIEQVLKSGSHTYKVIIPKDERNTQQCAILMPSDIGEVMPFRYAEIKVISGDVEIKSAKRTFVHYPFDDNASYFSCDNDTLNKVWDMCKHTIKATTFAGTYVDGDRERIPYEGDVYINQLAHYCVDREYAIARRSHEYLLHYPTWPTEWVLSSVLIAWEDYIYTGDKASLEKFYDLLKDKSLLGLADDNGLFAEPEQLSDEWKSRLNMDHEKYIFGNHLDNLVDWPPGSFTEGGIGERDNYEMMPVNTVVNAYFYRCLVIMKNVSDVLNKKEESKCFEEAATKAKRSIQSMLLDSETGLFVDGIGSTHSAAHANFFALLFGLAPSESVSTILDFLSTKGMPCSVYGAQHLLDALYEYGRGDLGLNLMIADSNRSWKNMLKYEGTMTWEAWDHCYKNNLDWNHAWGAAPANIIPRRLMGIIPASPAFETVQIRPQLGCLKSAEIVHPTIKGPISMKVEQNSDSIEINLSLPALVKAEVILPICLKGKTVKIDDREVSTKISSKGVVINKEITGEVKVFAGC